jgi:hypothetical protein
MFSMGILYVATNKSLYLGEAVISADSAKQHCPDIPIALFTDQLNHPLCKASCFDSVIEVDHLGMFVSTRADGKLSRIRCLRQTPYEYTLHLDTDTRIATGELSQLFQMLEEVDVAMVETAVDDSYSRKHYGRRMFNGGLILYRRNRLVWDWLDRWATLSERNFRLAGETPVPILPAMSHVADEIERQKLLCMDQVALVEILSPEVNVFGLKLRTLDYSWNYRGSRLIENNRQSPRILHFVRRKADYPAEFEAAVRRRLPENQILPFLG